MEILHNWKPEYNIVSTILFIYNPFMYPNAKDGYGNKAVRLISEGKNN